MSTLSQPSKNYYELPEWYTKDFEGKVFETQENLNKAIIVLEGISSNFENLGRKTWNIFQRAKGEFDNPDDVRYLVFDHLLQHLECSRICLKLLIFSLKNESLRQQAFKSEDVNKVYEMLGKKFIYTPLRDFYHSLENCFWTLLKALTNKDPGKSSYNDLVKGLLGNLFSNASDKETYSDTLTTLNWTRNTVHNNWVHLGKSATYTIKGLPFSFEENESIFFPSLNHIFVLLEEVVHTLEAIIFHPDVIKLKSEDCEERAAKL